MGSTTGISWTNSTWGPWQGCRRVSPGCDHCYMHRDKARYGQDGGSIHRSSDATVRSILSQKKYPPGSTVFVCSWSDFFIEEADAWRSEAWDLMARRPDLTFLLLTKRPENIASRLPADWPRPNVWLGTTTENQAMAELRTWTLLNAPHARHCGGLFVSCEPLLGPVDFDEIEALCRDFRRGVTIGTYLDFVIAGGESGPQARPSHPDWFRSLRDQCERSRVGFHFKQWGEWAPYVDENKFTHGGAETTANAHIWMTAEGKGGRCWIYDGDGNWTNWTGEPPQDESTLTVFSRIGRHAAGRLLDGREHNDMPGEVAARG